MGRRAIAELGDAARPHEVCDPALAGPRDSTLRPVLICRTNAFETGHGVFADCRGRLLGHSCAHPELTS
jgi:hypothetical protein